MKAIIDTPTANAGDATPDPRAADRLRLRLMGIVRCLVAGAPSQWSAAKRDRTLNSALELTLGVTPDDAKAVPV